MKRPLNLRRILLVLGVLLYRSDLPAQPAYLVKDINIVVDPSPGLNPMMVAEIGGVVFFTATDSVHGNELWRSDGTPAGTYLVKDINPGTEAFFSLTSWAVLDGALYFCMSDGTTNGLWRTDGTAAGTTLVKAMGCGGLTEVNGTLFFNGSLGTDAELWKSDGTAAGTVLVKDINPTQSSSPSNLTNVNGTLFFTANPAASPANDVELWKSDGTAAGTVLVKDIRLGFPPSFPSQLTAVNGLVFFRADDGSTSDLWKSDGTAAGTVKLTNFFGIPSGLTRVGNTLFFTAIGGNGRELWKSDGTVAGTVQVKDINPGSSSSFPVNDPQRLADVNGTLFMIANDGTNGYELWKSDGTAAGTVLVKDVCSGACSAFFSLGQDTILFHNANGTLYFAPNDGVSGYELWKSDGTAAGTATVKDICAGACSAMSSTFDRFAANVGGTLFLGAIEFGQGREVWKSDGTAGGTVKLASLSSNSSSPQQLTEVNGVLFFRASDGTSGVELWKSDGTAAGTVLLKDIRPGSTSSNPQSLAGLNGLVFFSADDGTAGTELWSSDGTPAGTVIVKDINPAAASSTPTALINVNGMLYFAATDGATGIELWKSDGTTAGTVLLKDIRPGANPSSPANPANVNGTLFFAASDGSTGTELWKSDGTAAGTVLVKDVRPGINSSSPAFLTNVNGTLFFAADDGTNGVELWKSDGTAAGTVMVKNINPSTSFTDGPLFLTAVNATLFFTAVDGVNGRELWKSDGTGGGTVMVKDIAPGNNFAGPRALTAVNGSLLFAATDGVSGTELWRSDGTAAGTVLVRDLQVGPGSSMASQLPREVGGELLFAAGDLASGYELWKTGGTGASTLMVEDVAPGAPASSPADFTLAGSLVFFTANDGSAGRELWVLRRTDLEVVKTDSSDPAPVGSNLTYTLTVTNKGPQTASGVIVTDELPAGMSFVASTPASPTCVESASVVTCNLGNLGAGASRTARIVVNPTLDGLLLNQATAVCREAELDSSNNRAAENTTVEAVCSSPPTFSGLDSVSLVGCALRLDWTAAASGCPALPDVVYNLYRSTTAGFTPGPANLLASCVAGTSYLDSAGLEPNTTYYYSVRAEDASYGNGGPCRNGNEDANAVQLGGTTGAFCSTPPPPVSVFAVTSTDQRNRLQWLSPSSGASVMIRYSETAPPGNPSDGAGLTVRPLTPNAVDAFDHTSLTNGTTYYYTIFVNNGLGVFSTGRSSRGRPENTALASNPVKWIYTTGATSLAPPAVGSVYAVSNDRVLHAMNAGSAGGDWPSGWKPFDRMAAPAQQRSPVLPLALAGASKVVLLGSQDGHAYAVDGLSGELLWKSPLLGDMVQAAPAGTFTGFGGAYDLVLVGTRNSLGDNEFVALNPNTGKVAWSFDNGGGIGPINGMAAVDYANRRVYFASEAGGSPDTVWCLDLGSSGASLRWSKPIGGVGGSPILLNGRVYVGNQNGEVFALNASSGAVIWSYPLGDGQIKGFVLPDRQSNRLYVATTNTVWSLADDVTSASEVWRITSIPLPSTPLLAPGTSYVFVGGGDGRLYQLEVSGSPPPTLKWVTLGDPSLPAVVGSPALDVLNQMLYLGTESGAVYAVKVPLP